MSEIKSEKELLEKIESLGIEDEDTKKKVVCALIGHSLIQTTFFGYYYCARCGEQLGDSLGSFYSDAEKAVIVGHKCPTCEENFKKLTWKDKILCPDPFAEENE